MAAKIIWSLLAAEDLDRIVEFIARDSDRYAAQVAGDVLDAVEKARLFPRSGRIVPEFDDVKIRETLVYRYRIIYRIHDDAIIVAAIVHGARDLRFALESRVL